MFHSIRKPMLERMQFLEKLDQHDRADGTPRRSRLRQIPPETGQFLALMLAEAPAGEVIEIGTSAGYSTLWLALACETHQRNLWMRKKRFIRNVMKLWCQNWSKAAYWSRIMP